MKQLYQKPEAELLLMLPLDILTGSAGAGPGGKYDPSSPDEDWGL